eukprot:Blabericola_migrator_1__10682@NODE_609_length_7298_cov_332_353616_g442_i0_p3_GENE_NODE_609_length_7298_cov_332_353616_g442_i0NODE_609_length_7298_cov_332_353616_g442_i0_p3_ORF_typecomplete_len392_score34_29PfkB/PF00294_24/9e50Phos_pyr_kin/PF08543_12/0_00017DUF5615/PF18480_1/0_39DUF5615/PF18480_1/1_9e02_NODE_609_length_7298_cov_332_353616_g442_i059967171
MNAPRPEVGSFFQGEFSLTSLPSFTMPPLIRVIGSLNADMVTMALRCPKPGETLTASNFFVCPGGKGANQAVSCGRLSRDTSEPVDVEMVGAVGALDAHFDRLLAPPLREAGVNLSHIRVVDAAYTGVATIIVDAEGENRILLSPGANYQGMQPTSDVIGLALAAPMPDVIIMQGEIPLSTTTEIIKSLLNLKQVNTLHVKHELDIGPDLILNPAPAFPGGLPAELCQAVDHLILNETEAEQMTPSAKNYEQVVRESTHNLDFRDKTALYFHHLGVSHVIITLGSEGVYYSVAELFNPSAGLLWTIAHRIVNHLPATKVDNVVDTTGAGDTFVGAYAVEVARWRERRRHGQATNNLNEDFMDKAVTLAITAAGLCVQRPGAISSIPWGREI